MKFKLVEDIEYKTETIDPKVVQELDRSWKVRVCRSDGVLLPRPVFLSKEHCKLVSRKPLLVIKIPVWLYNKIFTNGSYIFRG